MEDEVQQPEEELTTEETTEETESEPESEEKPLVNVEDFFKPLETPKQEQPQERQTPQQPQQTQPTFELSHLLENPQAVIAAIAGQVAQQQAMQMTAPMFQAFQGIANELYSRDLQKGEANAQEKLKPLLKDPAMASDEVGGKFKGWFNEVRRRAASGDSVALATLHDPLALDVALYRFKREANWSEERDIEVRGGPEAKPSANKSEKRTRLSKEQRALARKWGVPENEWVSTDVEE